MSNENNNIVPKIYYTLDIGKTKFEGICIGMGEINGIIELGAIQEFWNREQLNELKYYAGSSVGALISILMAIGYSPLDILVSICSEDFIKGFKNPPNFMNISSTFGAYSMEIIRNKLKVMFMTKIGYFPTFKEMKEKYGKNIIIPVYCLSNEPQSRKQYFTTDNVPDMSIIDAAILSSSVPIVFERSVYKDKTYIDGAFTSICPIEELERIISKETDILCVSVERNNKNIDTIFGYLMEILKIPLSEQNIMENRNIKTANVILLSEPNTGYFKFDITTKRKIELFLYGLKQIKNFISKNEKK